MSSRPVVGVVRWSPMIARRDGSAVGGGDKGFRWKLRAGFRLCAVDRQCLEGHLALWV